jgi:hypothetical protein
MAVNDRNAIDEANRLYWESDESVASIADRLGWSRRALYDVIEPLPLETACDVCGTPLVFPNRSARAAGTMACVACAAREAEAAKQDDRKLRQAVDAEARDRRERAYAAGGAAILGVTMGAALTFLLVRKR